MPAVRTPSPTPAAPAPMLVPVGPHKGQQPLPLNRPLTLVGSTASARLYLPSKAISRCHAVVVNTGGGLFVRDLASRTHTRVNGQVIDDADLREGDVLQVGTFTFRFTDPTAPKVRPPALPAPPGLLLVDGIDEPLALRGRATLIGRRETADISLTETAASSAHTLLFVLEGKHIVRDLHSRTGTFVNGVKVHEQALSPGDVLRVGETNFRYVQLGGAAPARPAAAGAPVETQADHFEGSPVTPPAAPTAVPPEPAEPLVEDIISGEAGDLDLVPIDVAPHAGPGPRGAPDAVPLVGDEAGGGPGSAAPGLLEVGETVREAVAEVDQSDVAVSPGDTLDPPEGDGVAPSPEPVPSSGRTPSLELASLPELAPLQEPLPELAPLPGSAAPPATTETAAAENPARPAKGWGGRGKAAPGSEAARKSRNPFEVLAEADDLDLLPDAAPERPAKVRPPGDNPPDALLDLDPSKE